MPVGEPRCGGIYRVCALKITSQVGEKVKPGKAGHLPKCQLTFDARMLRGPWFLLCRMGWPHLASSRPGTEPVPGKRLAENNLSVCGYFSAVFSSQHLSLSGQ